MERCCCKRGCVTNLYGCLLQVKDQSNAAYALRQIYQKHLQPYENWCCQQHAEEAKLETRLAPLQCNAANRQGELGEIMAAQVLKAMLVSNRADVADSGAAIRDQADGRTRKRRRTQQVTSLVVIVFPSCNPQYEQ